jgi:phosphatidylserine/phosphatidylglycerophosphate/cardiolipin synthase-like enzyme
VPPTSTTDAGGVKPITVQQGFGAESGFWQIYFNAPTGSRDEATYVGGIDIPLAVAIDDARGTLDIAAFEYNNRVLTQAILDAHQRGVKVRIVTDDEHGLEDDDSTITQFINAGIPVVDDSRSALMHNKFTIIDGTTVWTGSMNYTRNGVYRNNNNLMMLRSRRAVESYQAEFNEMFERHEFGPRSTKGNGVTFTQDGTPVQILFAAEDEVQDIIIARINGAQSRIRFMAFSFTVDEIRDAILARASSGVTVQGIFENVGSETRFSELTPLFCAGLPMRQDGNPFIMHHKVFIIDDTVLTGSFNFSASATNSNDENMVIIEDSNLAAQFNAEFDRRWAEAATPDDLTCS